MHGLASYTYVTATVPVLLQTITILSIHAITNVFPNIMLDPESDNLRINLTSWVFLTIHFFVVLDSRDYMPFYVEADYDYVMYIFCSHLRRLEYELHLQMSGLVYFIHFTVVFYYKGFKKILHI